jgi:hypothetical protein
VVPDGVSTVMLALEAKLSWGWPLAYAVKTTLRGASLPVSPLSLTAACKVTLPLPTAAGPAEEQLPPGDVLSTGVAGGG